MEKVESIADLVNRLRNPGIDLFERSALFAEVTRRGGSAIHDLLPLIPAVPSLVDGLLRQTLLKLSDAPERTRVREEIEHHLAPNHDEVTRRVCMAVLADVFGKETQVGARLLDFAANAAHESKELRLAALDAVAKLPPSTALGPPLVRLLRDSDMTVVGRALSILRGYAGRAPADILVSELEHLASPTSSPHASEPVRCAAIELLGQHGEIDVFERVVLLPLRGEAEVGAVGRMVQHLLQKPRSVRRLSPKSFEHLVRRLLEQMSYDDVKVEVKWSHDDGVDVVAWYQDEKRLRGPTKQKAIVQCKRYQPQNLVGVEVVTKMVEALKAQQAARGLVITTSSFMPAALECQRSYQHIELIDGAALQGLLDRHFQAGLYRV